MSQRQNIQGSCGCSFLCNGLTIAFVVLKLTDVIDWSWKLVALPSIIYFSIAGTIALCIALWMILK